MSAWQVFFSWPAGGVWSNILASLIWAGGPIIYALIKQHRHHKLVEGSLERLHSKMDAMKSKKVQ